MWKVFSIYRLMISAHFLCFFFSFTLIINMILLVYFQNMLSSFTVRERNSQILMRSGRRLRQRPTASLGLIKAFLLCPWTSGSTPLMVRLFHTDYLFSDYIHLADKTWIKCTRVASIRDVAQCVLLCTSVIFSLLSSLSAEPDPGGSAGDDQGCSGRPTRRHRVPD